MADYITDVAVSMYGSQERDLKRWGYTKISVDLNKGAGGKDIFLWYRKDGSEPITRLQLTYKDSMSQGLINTSYKKINRDLNSGAGGSDVFLWFYRGSGEYDTPIVDIDFTTNSADDAQKFGNGWERLACDVNRKAGGRDVYMWLRRAQQTYICDLTATDSYSSDYGLFDAGYIRLDEDTNRGAGGRDIFIWYRQTTDPKRALTDLQVSISGSEYEQYRLQDYNLVDQDLNEGTGSDSRSVYLWYKRQGSEPIKAILLLLEKGAVSSYQRNGASVIKKDLNAGNKGMNEYICYKQ